MEALLVFMAFIVVVVIMTKISTYINERNDAKQTIYSKFSEAPKYKTVAKTNARYGSLVELYNTFYNDWFTLEYYEGVKKEVERRQALAEKYLISDTKHLKDKLCEISGKVAILNSKIRNFNPYLGLNSEYIDIKKIFSSVFSNLGDPFFVSFFGYKPLGYYNNGYIILVKDLILSLNSSYESLVIYHVSELKLNKRSQLETKVDKNLKRTDEVTSYKWFYSRKNGERDRRYSNNYKIYTVRKNIMYFDKIEHLTFKIDYLQTAENLIEKFNAFQNSFKINKNHGKDNSSNSINGMENSISIFSNSRKSITNKKFVYHPIFNYGIYLGEKDNNIHIEFLNNEEKIINKNIHREKLRFVFEYEFKIGLLKYHFLNKTIHFPNGDTGIVTSIYDSTIIKVMTKSGEKDVSIYIDKEFEKIHFQFTVDQHDVHPKHKSIPHENMIEENKSNYVWHTFFGRGKIIDEDDGLYKINFEEHGRRIIAKDFKGLTVLSGEEKKVSRNDFLEKNANNSENFFSENLLLEDKRFSDGNKKMQIEVGDVVKHPHFGPMQLSSSDDTYFEFTLINDSVKSFRKTNFLYNNFKVFKKNSLEFVLETENYVYHRDFGYGLILFIDDYVITVFWWSTKDVVDYDRERHFYLKRVEEERSTILKLLVNGIVKAKSSFYIIDEFRHEELIATNLISGKKEFLSYEMSQPADSNFESWLIASRSKIDSKLLFSCYNNEDYYTSNDYLEKKKEIDYVSCGNHLETSTSCRYKLIQGIGGIYLNIRYPSIEDYVLTKIVSGEIYHYDFNLESAQYDEALKRMCDRKLAIKVDNMSYITLKKLKELGIKHQDFFDFEKRLFEYLTEKKFSTVSKISNDIDLRLVSILPSNEAVMNLIMSFDSFRKYKFGEKEVIVIKESTLKRDFFETVITDFLIEKGIESIDIYDFADDIYDNFYLEIEIDVLIREIKRFSTLYYSDEMEKLYKNKEIYYREVF